VEEPLRFCPCCGGKEIDCQSYGSPGTAICDDCGARFTVLGVPVAAASARRARGGSQGRRRPSLTTLQRLAGNRAHRLPPRERALTLTVGAGRVLERFEADEPPDAALLSPQLAELGVTLLALCHDLGVDLRSGLEEQLAPDTIRK
jgi:hypothetical protein